MKHLAAALMMVSASVEADPWVTLGPSAYYELGPHTGLGINFSETSPGECEKARLVLVSEQHINEISLCTDKVCLGETLVFPSFDAGKEIFSFINLNPIAINAIVNHSTAKIKTDKGSVTVTLAGSKKAVINAHANCVREAALLFEPQQPAKPQPAESKTLRDMTSSPASR